MFSRDGCTGVTFDKLDNNTKLHRTIKIRKKYKLFDVIDTIL